MIFGDDPLVRRISMCISEEAFPDCAVYHKLFRRFKTQVAYVSFSKDLHLLACGEIIWKMENLVNF